MISKERIGLIGYWFATNYGGVASYYSLYSYLKSEGYKVFLVENPYYEIDKEGSDVFSRNFFFDIGAEIAGPFNNEQIGLLNSISDIFVLGSDQVITTSSIKSFGKLFLMEKINSSKKKIGFSLSCGGDSLKNKDIVDYAKPLIKKFDAISVRENTAVTLFNDIFDCDVRRVIDPIFFTSKEKYIDISLSTGIEFDNQRPYMLAYILDPNEGKKVAINKTADFLGLNKQVILDGRKGTHDKNLKMLDMQDFTLPELNFPEWLAYMANASYILTDSFHGAAMAIILNKPFIMLANYKRGYTRFLTLSEVFHLENKLLDSPSDINYDIVHENINYDEINVILDSEVKSGKKWLLDSIKKEKAVIDVKSNNGREEESINQNKIEKPFYSIESYKSKQYEIYDICSKDKCTGCSACMNICPRQCINMEADNEGFLYPLMDKTNCISCELCKKICPVLNIDKDNDGIKRFKKRAYAGFSLDNDIRFMSTSGGAFTVFANYILKMSGVVYGAAYNNHFGVEHTGIEDTLQLPLIRQSKYMQSNINRVYSLIKRDLEQNRYVLFCGTPCQCAGLKNYLGKDYTKLFIIDFICHSICSPKAFKSYLDEIKTENNDKVKRVWFKNKETTWKNFSIRIDFEKGNYYRKTVGQDPYFKAFLKYRLCSRPSCHNCLFKGEKRYSDVTLADFWGLKWNNPELDEENMKNGVSLIITNTEKGQDIFEKFCCNRMYVEEHTLADAVIGNGGYYNSERPGLYRDYFWKNLDNVPFSKIISAIEENEKSKEK